MSRLIDLTGQRFGRLTVIERAGQHKGRSLWKCKCDCSKITVVSVSQLLRGRTKSCGCLRNENISRIAKKHGMSHTRLYHIWIGMKKRCYDPNAQYFEIYGGRGITVCDEWLHDFMEFQRWALSHGYSDELSIDRIDNDKGYSPDNCRWATWHEQRMNQRRMTKKTE